MGNLPVFCPGRFPMKGGSPAFHGESSGTEDRSAMGISVNKKGRMKNEKIFMRPFLCNLTS